jgi:hypothetical protein
MLRTDLACSDGARREAGNDHEPGHRHLHRDGVGCKAAYQASQTSPGSHLWKPHCVPPWLSCHPHEAISTRLKVGATRCALRVNRRHHLLGSVAATRTDRVDHVFAPPRPQRQARSRRGVVCTRSRLLNPNAPKVVAAANPQSSARRAHKRHDDRGDLARVQRDQSAFGPFAKLQLRWLASAVGGCYARGSESCVAVEIEHAPLGVCVMTIITTEWTTTASKHPGVPEAATTT